MKISHKTLIACNWVCVQPLAVIIAVSVLVVLKELLRDDKTAPSHIFWVSPLIPAASEASLSLC